MKRAVKFVTNFIFVLKNDIVHIILVRAQ